MFSYHFTGLNDDAGTFAHSGTTFDFLELCALIAEVYDPEICGKFIEYLMQDKADELSFLRVIDWNFECRIVREGQKQIVIRVERVLP